MSFLTTIRRACSLRLGPTTTIHRSPDSVKKQMTFWSLMVQTKAKPGDPEVKASICQLLSSDPSQCVPCGRDLWRLPSNEEVSIPKALLSLSPGKTAVFFWKCSHRPFSFNKILLQSSHIIPGIFYLRLQSCVLQMIHKEKTCIFIQPASGWRAGVLVKQGILCGNQFFVEVSILRMSVQPKFQREIISLSMPNTWRSALQVSKIKWLTF